MTNILPPLRSIPSNHKPNVQKYKLQILGKDTHTHTDRQTTEEILIRNISLLHSVFPTTTNIKDIDAFERSWLSTCRAVTTNLLHHGISDQRNSQLIPAVQGSKLFHHLPPWFRSTAEFVHFCLINRIGTMLIRFNSWCTCVCALRMWLGAK